MNCINLDFHQKAFGKKPTKPSERVEVVGTKTATQLESDLLARFNKSHPQGRPEGGLTIEEMAKAANTSHGTIKRWLETQKGYKAILGTKQYATRKQVVTYYVKK